MDTNFQIMVKDYHLIKDVDEQRAVQILNEIRQAIRDMTGGFELYKRDNQIIRISTATIDELCMIYEGLTKITSELLLKKGFKTKTIDEKVFYKKGAIGLCWGFNVWILVTFEFGQPLHNNTYIKYWEEFEYLANQPERVVI